MGMRMTGLVSGMDTESMVKELVAASSTKVDKVKNRSRLYNGSRRHGRALTPSFMTSIRMRFQPLNRQAPLSRRRQPQAMRQR